MRCIVTLATSAELSSRKHFLNIKFYLRDCTSGSMHAQAIYALLRAWLMGDTPAVRLSKERFSKLTESIGLQGRNSTFRLNEVQRC